MVALPTLAAATRSSQGKGAHLLDQTGSGRRHLLCRQVARGVDLCLDESPDAL
jgi:hypothetical protein